MGSRTTGASGSTGRVAWRATLGAGLVLVLAAGCSSGAESTAEADPVRLDELQYIGTHNSYHVQPSEELFEAEKAAVDAAGVDLGDIGDIDSLLYTHAPLTEQLESGIRSFELDIWADPEGGLFSDPLAPAFLGVDTEPLPETMDDPGFKALHIVDVDTGSTCPVFVECLTEIRAFSEAHPDHVPIIVMVELKDEPLPPPIDATEVVEIDGTQLDALDAEIRSVFEQKRLLTPDDVRGDAVSLREAVRSDGWPTVDESAGTVMFFMDNGGRYRDAYIEGRPNLEGRVLFTSDGVGRPDGAVAKVNDPGDGEEIRQLVDDGYLVRTRADADLNHSEERRDVALASGAQIVSSDFPRGTMNGDGAYEVDVPGPLQVRCNPVRAESGCTVDTLE